MEHKEYIKICEDSDVVVLFIHGTVGTPNHFNEFVSLIPNGVSVYNMLLDGHGKGVKDFSRSSMEKWERQVESVLGDLSHTHKKIYVVAHSLGALLAIEQAIKSDKISKMFLLAVPLKLSIKPKMPINSLKVYFDKIRPDDLKALAAKNCYGIEKDKNIFNYIGWLPRLFELFAKMRKTCKSIHLLNTSCYVYQSNKDEMVSKRSIKILNKSPSVTIKILENSGHYYYDKNDNEYLLAEFKNFLN